MPTYPSVSSYHGGSTNETNEAPFPNLFLGDVIVHLFRVSTARISSDILGFIEQARLDRVLCLVTIHGNPPEMGKQAIHVHVQ
jgi:hypothetical protein